jgi:hypothetical protein
MWGGARQEPIWPNGFERLKVIGWHLSRDMANPYLEFMRLNGEPRVNIIHASSATENSKSNGTDQQPP